MKYIFAILLLSPALSFAQWGAYNSCGPKPYGTYGCKQVCVDGNWNEVCDDNKPLGPSYVSCGPKPYAQYGCRNTCINGQWIETCN